MSAIGTVSAIGRLSAGWLSCCDSRQATRRWPPLSTPLQVVCEGCMSTQRDKPLDRSRGKARSVNEQHMSDKSGDVRLCRYRRCGRNLVHCNQPCIQQSETLAHYPYDPYLNHAGGPLGLELWSLITDHYVNTRVISIALLTVYCWPIIINELWNVNIVEVVKGCVTFVGCRVWWSAWVRRTATS